MAHHAEREGDEGEEDGEELGGGRPRVRQILTIVIKRLKNKMVNGKFRYIMGSCLLINIFIKGSACH